jgi:ABC-type antimicrobial peptide transport system permease subunit
MRITKEHIIGGLIGIPLGLLVFVYGVLPLLPPTHTPLLHHSFEQLLGILLVFNFNAFVWAVGLSCVATGLSLLDKYPWYGCVLVSISCGAFFYVGIALMEALP